MALDKSIVPVLLNQGIDTKSDPKTVQAKLLILENGVFIAKNKIKKRNGTALLGTLPTDSGAAIMTFKNELCALDGTSFYSYNASISGRQDQGDLTSIHVTKENIYGDPNGCTVADSAYNDAGMYGFSWIGDGGCYMSIMDADTGAKYNVRNLSTSNKGIRVIALGRYILFIFVDSSSLKFSYVDVASPNATPATVTLTLPLYMRLKPILTRR
jgi:hypothetical protein